VSKLLVFLFLTVSAGFADTIQFTGLPVNTQYGTYNGYAFATIDGTPLQALICDDFDHTTYVPSGNMAYSLSTLMGVDPLQYARFVDPNDWDGTIAQYEEAALLLDGLRQTGSGLLLDLTADYQYALWHLFTPSVVLPDATARTLLNDAASSVQQGGASNQAIYSELGIFTPTAAYASNQEFLQLAANPTPGSPNSNFSDTLATPETSPGFLVGIGIAAIVLSLGTRRLMQTKGAAATLGIPLARLDDETLLPGREVNPLLVPDGGIQVDHFDAGLERRVLGGPGGSKEGAKPEEG
jgi:hypothetical protein